MYFSLSEKIHGEPCYRESGVTSGEAIALVKLDANESRDPSKHNIVHLTLKLRKTLSSYFLGKEGGFSRVEEDFLELVGAEGATSALDPHSTLAQFEKSRAGALVIIAKQRVVNKPRSEKVSISELSKVEKGTRLPRVSK